VKKLSRTPLKRNPAERASLEEFFGSTALAKSRFPRLKEEQEVSVTENSMTGGEVEEAGVKGWTAGNA
jgi:serine/threonine-protein kinase ULK/ATG1